MTGRLAAWTCLLAFAAGPSAAMTLALPERAQQTAEVVEDYVSTDLPIGAWNDGWMPTVQAEGREVMRAWVLRGGGLTTAQLIIPIRQQLVEQGYEILYECETALCGGFDFRFALDLIPAPQMFVDLGDFRYLLAASGSGAERHMVSVVTSRGESTGHVHVTEIAPTAFEIVTAPAEPVETPPPALPGPETTGLFENGRVVLEGLAFQSGSAEISDAGYAGLERLATFLSERPGARIALVGHTDATGSLEQNIELSRRRAEAVRQQLIGEHGANPAQLDAQGVGYLAPRADNSTEAGRKANRRVEAVLLDPG